MGTWAILASASCAASTAPPMTPSCPWTPPSVPPCTRTCAGPWTTSCRIQPRTPLRSGRCDASLGVGRSTDVAGIVRPIAPRVPCAAVDESNRRDRHADGCDPSSALPSDLHTRTGLARGMSFALCVADRGCPGSAGRGRSDRRLSNRYCRGQAHRLRAPEDRQRGRPQLPWVRRGHRAQPADSLAQEGIHHDRPRRASVARWSSTWRRRRSTRSKPDPRPGSRQVSGTQWSATVARTELAATDPVGPEGESGRPSDRFRPSG